MHRFKVLYANSSILSFQGKNDYGVQKSYFYVRFSGVLHAVDNIQLAWHPISNTTKKY